jgi:hypothetical protein
MAAAREGGTSVVLSNLSPRVKKLLLYFEVHSHDVRGSDLRDGPLLRHEGADVPFFTHEP